jgi:hypothetical protein
MLSLWHDLGFVSWRYDMVKGYAGWAVELYNRETEPLFSVGEYLDGDVHKVMAWSDSSHPDPTWRSPTFDYPRYFIRHEAVVNRRHGRLKYADRSVGVLGMWAEKAVTFADNHDVEGVRNGKYGPTIPSDGRVMWAYGFPLVNNGAPSVFWSEIYDSRYEASIRDIIWIRKHYGIASNGRFYVEKAVDGGRLCRLRERFERRVGREDRSGNVESARRQVAAAGRETSSERRGLCGVGRQRQVVATIANTGNGASREARAQRYPPRSFRRARFPGHPAEPDRAGGRAARGDLQPVLPRIVRRNPAPARG